MNLQHVSAVKEAFIVSVDAMWPWYSGIQREIHHDQWTEYVLADDVKAWLDANAPSTSVVCDQGDWGEGSPIWKFYFASKFHAEAFWAVYGRDEEDDRVERTWGVWGTLDPALIVEENGEWRLTPLVTDWLAANAPDAKITFKPGEFAHLTMGASLEFSNSDLANRFQNEVVWPNKPFRNNKGNDADS